MTNPTQAALLDALTTGRKYVELQNRAEGMFEGFGGRKPRPSDGDLAAIDRAISLLSAANAEPPHQPTANDVARMFNEWKPSEMAQAEQTARVGEVPESLVDAALNAYREAFHGNDQRGMMRAALRAALSTLPAPVDAQRQPIEQMGTESIFLAKLNRSLLKSDGTYDWPADKIGDLLQQATLEINAYKTIQAGRTWHVWMDEANAALDTPAAHTAQSADNQLSASAGAQGKEGL